MSATVSPLGTFYSSVKKRMTKPKLFTFLCALGVIAVTLSGCARPPLIIEPYATQIPDSATAPVIGYIVNTDTKKFHLPSCSKAEKINEKNKKIVTNSRDELLAKQYSPCGICKP